MSIKLFLQKKNILYWGNYKKKKKAQKTKPSSLAFRLKKIWYFNQVASSGSK